MILSDEHDFVPIEFHLSASPHLLWGIAARKKAKPFDACQAERASEIKLCSEAARGAINKILVALAEHKLHQFTAIWAIVQKAMQVPRPLFQVIQGEKSQPKNKFARGDVHLSDRTRDGIAFWMVGSI